MCEHGWEVAVHGGEFLLFSNCLEWVHDFCPSPPVTCRNVFRSKGYVPAHFYLSQIFRSGIRLLGVVPNASQQ